VTLEELEAVVNALVSKVGELVRFVNVMAENFPEHYIQEEIVLPNGTKVAL
jgi:hypothetical protein